MQSIHARRTNAKSMDVAQNHTEANLSVSRDLSGVSRVSCILSLTRDGYEMSQVIKTCPIAILLVTIHDIERTIS